MPTSAADGRSWVYNRVSDSTTELIVDAGAGEGTYSTLCRHLRLDARWVALEIHEPYVERFLLGHKYDDVIVTDVRTWKPDIYGYTILLGDVLEHMPKTDAVDLLNWHKDHAAEIMVSVPIVYSPQGECYGNPHETHAHMYHFEEMLDMLGGNEQCESFRGVTVGRYWWRSEP